MESYQSRLQATIEYNRTVNLTRKIFKSKKKCMLPLLPIMYQKPSQSKLPPMVPVEPVVSMKSVESKRPVPIKSSVSKRPGSSKKPVITPIKSGRVRKSRATSKEVLVKSKRPVKLHGKSLQCNQAPYIPPAEEKENFETLLSILESAAVETDRGDIGQTSDQYKSSSKTIAIQVGRGDISPPSDHQYASQAVDELLANLFTNDRLTVRLSLASISRPSNAHVVSNSTSARQSSSRFDFLDLPITPYQVPPSYIEDMINSLVILSRRKQTVYYLLTRN